MQYRHWWHRYIEIFPLKKHALLFESVYMLREFLSFPVYLKIYILKKCYPWINLYLNTELEKTWLWSHLRRCKSGVTLPNCLQWEWFLGWCILWRSMFFAINKRQLPSSDQTIVQVCLIETLKLFDERGGLEELKERFLQSAWRKLLSYSSSSEERKTGVFLTCVIRKEYRSLKYYVYRGIKLWF